MQPYGIVYEESLFSLEQSVTVWHKKCGVLKGSSFLKMILVMICSYAVIMAGCLIFTRDMYYAMLVVVLFTANTVLLPISIKNSFLKPTARANFQKGEKQIVVFSDRIEYTTPYGKSVYFYEDIVYAGEKNGIVTIIVDTAALPLCVPSGCVKKGEFNRFLAILQQHMGENFERGKK